VFEKLQDYRSFFERQSITAVKIKLSVKLLLISLLIEMRGRLRPRDEEETILPALRGGVGPVLFLLFLLFYSLFLFSLLGRSWLGQAGLFPGSGRQLEAPPPIPVSARDISLSGVPGSPPKFPRISAFPGLNSHRLPEEAVYIFPCIQHNNCLRPARVHTPWS
jgi:hypothetical protein